jgi:hypothetical protein
VARAVAALVEQRAAALEQSMESRLRVKVRSRAACCYFASMVALDMHNAIYFRLSHESVSTSRSTSAEHLAARAYHIACCR